MKKIIEISDRKNNKISIIVKNISYFEELSVNNDRDKDLQKNMVRIVLNNSLELWTYESYNSFKNRFNEIINTTKNTEIKGKTIKRIKSV
ncbi:hypothetical protein M0Q97_13235 [Candidatus Dojkabacteria bacterium]|jgi:hypothetical protein|nr:hypothetical protein [Candidatus Dojkabacteria bacterium]